MQLTEKSLGRRAQAPENVTLSRGVSETEFLSAKLASGTSRVAGPAPERPIINQEIHEPRQSLPAVLGETPPTGLTLLSENWNLELLASAKLIDKSANALYSHMSKLLDGEDLRPVEERTTQAVMCAREIALLIRTKVEIVRAAK